MSLFLKKMLLISFSVALLGACQTNGQPNTDQAKRAHQAMQSHTQVLGYFTRSGQYTTNPAQAVYQRNVYGQNQKNHWLVQDFYINSQQPQTSIFTIFDERGLHDWDILSFTEGPVMLYFPDGSKQALHHRKKGKPSSTSTYYYPNGTVYKNLTFNHLNTVNKEEVFLPNGQLLMRLQADRNSPDGFSSQIFDAQGKAYDPSPSTRPIFTQALSYIQQVQQQLQQKQNAIP